MTDGFHLPLIEADYKTIDETLRGKQYGGHRKNALRICKFMYLLRRSHFDYHGNQRYQHVVKITTLRSQFEHIGSKRNC